MKNTAITVCSCIALISFSVLCASGVWALRSVNSVAVALPAQVDQRVASIQKDVNRQLSTAIADANSRINSALTVVDQRTGQALKIIDSRSAGILEQTHGIAAVAQHVAILAESDLNARLTDTNKILAETALPITESSQQVNEALPLFLDCDHNSDCVFNRFQGTSKSVERTSQIIATEMPKMTAYVDKIAAASVVTADSVAATSVEVKKAAQNFNKPQTKWQAFRAWITTIAKIWGAL